MKPSLLNRLGIAVATRILLKANMIAVTMKSYVEYLKREHGYDRALHISHGTSITSNFTYDMETEPEKTILLFGHMAPHKGLPIMLEAFKELLNEREDIELCIAGTDHPNFKGYLEQFKIDAIPKVEYLGYIPEENLEELFLNSNLVVLPYLTATGTSGVFHIACGFGKPIIASNLPEIRELVSEGASAVLVRPGDPSALKDAICHLLDNPKLSLEMRRKNLSFASKETWSKIAEAYKAAYLKLING